MGKWYSIYEAKAKFSAQRLVGKNPSEPAQQGSGVVDLFRHERRPELGLEKIRREQFVEPLQTPTQRRRTLFAKRNRYQARRVDVGSLLLRPSCLRGVNHPSGNDGL